MEGTLIKRILVVSSILLAFGVAACTTDSPPTRSASFASDSGGAGYGGDGYGDDSDCEDACYDGVKIEITNDSRNLIPIGTPPPSSPSTVVIGGFQ